ncbi:hypothetical protein TanjilG_06600 [Lupinus angustifolius]|uniref:Leucine-rich repeat-containing N-terminal plant-type domain-containing protein n=1 Tax=Lupinus angustifolius TaxID=3871 RepID=A0A394DAQ3_LUPAN|nr:hypothetical protein TanjilG_06600 [Lupinus angustifolius]
MKPFFIFLILIALFVLVESSCNIKDQDLVSKAFHFVSGFNPSWFQTKASSSSNCSITQIKKIELASKNLIGTISWGYLRNMSKLEILDLSENSLQGHVPNWLWTSSTLLIVNLSNNRFRGNIASKPITQNDSFSSLQSLNLSHNRFTNQFYISGFSNLKSLDLSHNNLVTLPSGFENITNLHLLDLSNCNIKGNRFKKFGKSAFIHAGNNFNYYNASKIPNLHSTTTTPPQVEKQNPVQLYTTEDQKKKQKSKTMIVAASCGALVLLLLLSTWVLFKYRNMRQKMTKKNKWAISKPVSFNSIKMEKSGLSAFRTESGTSWVADLKEPSSAAVVMLEKPLMNDRT